MTTDPIAKFNKAQRRTNGVMYVFVSVGALIGVVAVCVMFWALSQFDSQLAADQVKQNANHDSIVARLQNVQCHAASKTHFICTANLPVVGNASHSSTP